MDISIQSSNPRGEDLGVEYLYRGSSFVEKVKIKGCWNKKATVSVICCQPKETCSSNRCRACVPSAAQKSAWAFPKSCPFCLALMSSVLLSLALPPATVCFLGTWRGLGITLINPCSLALVTRTSKESSAWRSRDTIWGWAINLILNGLCFLGFRLTFIEHLLCFRHCVK